MRQHANIWNFCHIRCVEGRECQFGGSDETIVTNQPITFTGQISRDEIVFTVA